MKCYDSIVVGGGIIGAACALELHKQGQKVLVLDSSQPGTGVTAACMGHIAVMDDSPSMLEFTAYSRQLWQELVDELPEDCEDFKPGTLWIAQDDDEMDEALKKKKKMTEAGVQCQIVDADGLKKLEPNLRKGLAGGLRVPDDRVLYPTNCVRYMLRGIDCQYKSAVEAVCQGQVTLVGGRKVYADHIVVASGVASSQLLNLPISPKKGHLVITERYPQFANHQIIELGYIKKAHSNSNESTAFNIQPRKSGQMLIGSSREYSGFDKSINKKILGQMLDRARYFLPTITHLKCLRVWTGFRPSTPDGKPYIGSVSPGIYACVGHEGLGITTSLASAKVIAAHILGTAIPIETSPYSPSRINSPALTHEH